ncbi:MAG: hypothetical protein MJK15_00590 [Colwellia sp.]|nr:hypothetical protein [Colwellia sp.]
MADFPGAIPSGGALDPAQEDAVDSIIALADGEIPQASGNGLIASSMTEDATDIISEKPLGAPSLDVLPGTVSIGPHALKSGGQTFTFTNTIDQEAFEPVWIDQATGVPFARKPVGNELTFPFETSKADIIINPIWDVTPTFNQRTVAVTFETDTTITNVIGQVFTGGQLFYQAELGTLAANVETEILLDPTTDNVPVDVFVGPTYEFRLISADGDVRAKGSTTNALPFFTLKSFAFADNQVTIHDEADQRQIIRSGVKGNFSVAMINSNTQIQITADDASGSFEVFFIGNQDTDDLTGTSVLVPDVTFDINNAPVDRYFIHATPTGSVGSSGSKQSITNPNAIHLFEFVADVGVFGQPGTGFPSSLNINPRITWSDMTFQTTLEAAGTVIEDLIVSSTDDATMGISTTSFLMVANGINYKNSKLSPHSLAVSGQDPQSWTYIDSSLVTVPPINTDVLLDATQWDNNGVLTAVGNNEATVQGVLVNNGNFIIMRGDVLFANYDDALLNMDSVEFDIPDVISGAVLVTRIVLKGNATDSADTQEVTIRNLPSSTGGTASTDLFVTQSLTAPTFEDARFFSELGLADTQTPPWNIIQSGSATVTIVSESVMGIIQDVHKLSDNTSGGIATVLFPLTAQNWTDIFNLDASYGGVIRLDSTNGDEGCFWGLGCTSADSPDASPDKRRFGLNFKKSLTTNELRIFATDGNTLDVDVPGTSFDAYNEIVVKITRGTPPTAEVFVNGSLQGTMDFLAHVGGTATDCSWSSGSTGGTDRITYVSNYGVTIYTSQNNFIVGDSALSVNVARLLLPPGNRDYTVSVSENVTGAALGKSFQFTGLNIGGSITANNENPANPKALFNGLKSITIPVTEILDITGVNSVDGGNVYNFKL